MHVMHVMHVMHAGINLLLYAFIHWACCVCSVCTLYLLQAMDEPVEAGFM